MKLPKQIRRVIGMRVNTGKQFPVRTMNPVRANYIYYDVPFIPQRHVNLCSDACALMLLQFCGIDTEGKSTRQNPRGIFQGQNTDELKENYPADWERVPLVENRQWTSDLLGAYLIRKGPIICNFSSLGGLTGHAVLLTGVDGDRLYFNDPWRGKNTTKSLEEFNKSLDWGNPDSMLYVRSPKPPPSVK